MTTAELVRKTLFTPDAAGSFVILDGASVPGLLDQLGRQRPSYECLYRGELAPDMAEVAPYLVALETDAHFTRWVIENGWGKHWGVFVESDADLRALRLHFRRLLTVHDESGKPLLFRYYDPRVLPTYLVTCNARELLDMFGPVKRFVMEGESPEQILEFGSVEGKLRKRQLGPARSGAQGL